MTERAMQSHSKSKALNRSRLLLALVVTPLLVAFYSAVWFAQPWALPFGMLIAYPSAVLIGMPLLFLLRQTGRMQGGYFAGVGVICALPALWIDSGPLLPPQFEALDVGNALYLLVAGALSGVGFWLLGIAGDSPLRWRSLLDIGPPG